MSFFPSSCSSYSGQRLLDRMGGTLYRLPETQGYQITVQARSAVDLGFDKQPDARRTAAWLMCETLIDWTYQTPRIVPSFL
jgi:hypothetical protein